MRCIFFCTFFLRLFSRSNFTLNKSNMTATIHKSKHHATLVPWTNEVNANSQLKNWSCGVFPLPARLFSNAFAVVSEQRDAFSGSLDTTGVSTVASVTLPQSLDEWTRVSYHTPDVVLDIIQTRLLVSRTGCCVFVYTDCGIVVCSEIYSYTIIICYTKNWLDPPSFQTPKCNFILYQLNTKDFFLPLNCVFVKYSAHRTWT